MTQPALPLVFNPTQHEVVWRPSRPELTVQFIRGHSTSTGYHESYYDVICRRELSHDDLRRLAEMDIFGIGQAWHLIQSKTVEDTVNAVVIDKSTGQVVEGLEPRNQYTQELITKTHTYTFYHYVVRRICDSGD